MELNAHPISVQYDLHRMIIPQPLLFELIVVVYIIKEKNWEVEFWSSCPYASMPCVLYSVRSEITFARLSFI